MNRPSTGRMMQLTFVSWHVLDIKAVMMALIEASTLTFVQIWLSVQEENGAVVGAKNNVALTQANVSSRKKSAVKWAIETDDISKDHGVGGDYFDIKAFMKPLQKLVRQTHLLYVAHIVPSRPFCDG
ncbi:hypothetical protein FGB62_395g01 [Gracilaria domingensis]|nr:hypothetical protein FGB62_395g01 [Gracilaria domingensis]